MGNINWITLLRSSIQKIKVTIRIFEKIENFAWFQHDKKKKKYTE